MTSSRASARADAGRDGLLADRDVEEPGQLAGAEALLDLLLEPADEEHLAEEAAEHLLGDATTPGLGSLFDGGHRAAIMLIRPMAAADEWTRIQAGLDPDWAEVRLAFTPEGSSSEAAAVLAPLQPVHVGDELRFHVTRSDAGAERVQERASRASTESASGGRSGSIDVAASRPPTAAAPSVQPSPIAGSRSGTKRSQRSLPTGATCWPSSSSTRATTSRGPHSSALR